MKKNKNNCFHVFFHEMAAILDCMMLSKEHITSKLLFQTKKKMCIHVENGPISTSSSRNIHKIHTEYFAFETAWVHR